MTFSSVRDTSSGEIFGRISRDLSRLFSAELELAKRELRSEFRTAMRTAVAAGIAILSGYLLLLFLSVAAMFGLGSLMNLGWAALIVAGVWGLVSIVLVMRVRRMASRISPIPRTRRRLKEDRQWISTVRG